MRRMHASVEINVEYDGELIPVLVLRPIHPNDVLAVEYTAEALTAVPPGIRSSGFDGPSQIRVVTMPQGYPQATQCVPCYLHESRGSESFEHLLDN